mgnify:CR=1 FL=1
MELIETTTAVKTVPMADSIKGMMERIVVHDPLPAGSGHAAEIDFIEQADAVSIQCPGRKGKGNSKSAAPWAGPATVVGITGGGAGGSCAEDGEGVLMLAMSGFPPLMSPKRGMMQALSCEEAARLPAAAWM